MMNRIWLFCSAIMIVAVGVLVSEVWADRHRFFYEGDGRIALVGQKSGHQFAGVYRNEHGKYDETAYRAICRVFGAPYDAEKPALSLRLIAFLDYLQDDLGPGRRITITSGYRSPKYNTQIRQGGGLAAKASLHQYGMAADLKMAGVPSKRIWDHVKALGFGGTGYYHGATVHLDVGPARSWDETTSGVGTGLSDDNKLVGLVTDFDRYPANTTVTLRFIRMTAFPIGVAPTFILQRVGKKAASEVMRFIPDFGNPNPGPCRHMSDIEQMASIQWQLPNDLPPGRYTILARFCDPQWEKMPEQVVTPVFEIFESE